jgi:hypothetical protein
MSTLGQEQTIYLAKFAKLSDRLPPAYITMDFAAKLDAMIAEDASQAFLFHKNQ